MRFDRLSNEGSSGALEDIHQVMGPSFTITLFSERQELGQRPTSFVTSILVHGVALGMLSYGIMFSPKIRDRVLAERYSMRQLDLHTNETQMRRIIGSGVVYPGPQVAEQSPPAGGSPAKQPVALRRVAQLAPGTQTLVQFNVSSHLTLSQEIRVPNVVIWTPEETAAKTILPPPPQKPATADASPSLDLPNKAVNLADIAVAPTNMVAREAVILPSTTSPLVVHGHVPTQLVPVTTSVTSAKTSPAAVLSLSDLRMPNGTVTLPPVTESGPDNSTGALAPGSPAEHSVDGSGNSASRAGGVGAGQSTGNSGDKLVGSGGGARQSGARNGSDQGAASGSGSGNKPSVERITLPKDGQFGVVVVGSSLAEKFPETAELTLGRLTYTVYLHVGLAKSWILQYSLPRSADEASAGNTTRIQPPWPYNIVRPDILPGEINADALMIHGFVNQQGRFEGLTIAFPREFANGQFVLDALQQWQFRPAMQNGQIATVEVLLIIPEIQ